MYKLLLLDIDGTLRDEYVGVPQSSIDAIQMCKANNLQVIICTGRSIGTIQEDVKAIAVDGYICGGGSHMLYHGTTLWDEALPQDKVQEVVRLLNVNKVAFALESKEKVYMNQGAKAIFDRMNQSKQKQKNINKQFIQDVIKYEDNLYQFKKQRIHKLCLWTMRDIYNVVSAILGEHMELAQQDVYEGLEYYEIIQKGYHKGNALQHLQTYLHITKEETICFGDGDNDIEMLKASGCGIAMKTSHERLKQHACAICEDVCEDGIYKELRRRNII